MMWKEDHYLSLKRECPYKNSCKSSPFKCSSCKHNPVNDDHYLPKPWNPNPWSPGIEPWPNTTPWKPIWRPIEPPKYYCVTRYARQKNSG